MHAVSRRRNDTKRGGGERGGVHGARLLPVATAHVRGPRHLHPRSRLLLLPVPAGVRGGRAGVPRGVRGRDAGGGGGVRRRERAELGRLRRGVSGGARLRVRAGGGGRARRVRVRARGRGVLRAGVQLVPGALAQLRASLLRQPHRLSPRRPPPPRQRRRGDGRVLGGAAVGGGRGGRGVSPRRHEGMRPRLRALQDQRGGGGGGRRRGGVFGGELHRGVRGVHGARRGAVQIASGAALRVLSVCRA
mmetsp:Transcript_49972/g.118445  ORF Transcript_49972/g.118445 Transcript_49972/m.118445 type:complete len:247 (-) Transcript_49972:234-974(-)